MLCGTVKANYMTAIVSFNECLSSSFSDTDFTMTTIIISATKRMITETFVPLIYYLQDAKHMFALINTL